MFEYLILFGLIDSIMILLADTLLQRIGVTINVLFSYYLLTRNRKMNKPQARENNWLGRSLTNYKQMHANTANDKGVYKEFMASKTLTAAKKILHGMKRKNTR